MSYTDKVRTLHFLLDSKARDGANDMSPTNLIGDDTDLDGVIVPAAREVEIQGMKAYVFTADADAYVELCKEDNTVLCRISLANTGHVSAIQASSSSAQTFPITVAAQSTTLPKLIKLRTDQAVDTDCKATIEVTFSGLGHA